VIISVPTERAADERRVALTPDVVKRLAKQSVDVRIEHDAGRRASYVDAAYEAAGATIVTDADGAWRDGDIVLRVQRPLTEGGRDEVQLLKEGAIVVGMLYPLTNHDLVRQLADRKVTSFSLDQLPRITRAQTMDVLSSMSTIAGYRAVLIAAANHGKFFPMLITAAGTIPPAKALVIGAGVAGLQAIATARRLGAVVEAFDVRPAVKEQVESLGAKFIAAEQITAEGEGGYAKELSDEQHKRELELIHEHCKTTDVVITTALIPGRPAPELITEATVKDMRPGSVIVDLAAETGGNCALTERGEVVERHGVKIVGTLNLPAGMPGDASQMYAKNMQSFLSLLIDKEGKLTLDFEDEIIKGTCITHEGRVVHEATRQAIEGGKGS
jgi:proton-translocating NAD(P)+ transhydrogenase subunit alpha